MGPLFGKVQGLFIVFVGGVVTSAAATYWLWQVTTDSGTDQFPSWSPDGLTLAFSSDRSGNDDIWVIPATGGSET